MNISLYGAVMDGIEIRRTLHSVMMMNRISHQIENQIIKHKMTVDLYSGFQKFSRFVPQATIYRRVGEASQSVTIFGLPDVTPAPLPNVEYYALTPKSPLVHEWFLLVDTPEFWTLLTTREMEAPDPLTGQRRFEGIWTFDVMMISRASRFLRRALGRPAPTITRRYEASQERHVAEMTESLLKKVDSQDHPTPGAYR